MGAALKIDCSQIRVDEFWNVKGCPLARALRQRFKRTKQLPRRKFKVVYSPEVLPNLGEALEPVGDVEQTVDWNARKAQINGSLVHITAVFGFTIVGEVMKDIYQNFGLKSD